jgi:DNA polymerase
MVQNRKIILQVDIESYSSIDLAEAGVYRYTEAPDFEVMLVGYAFDDEDPHVIDLMTDGYPGTTETDRAFWKALTDPEVEKHSYNAAFERQTLGTYTGKEMPPEQWVCTMVRALTLGLPGSLAGVGEAMGLPKDVQKDKQGKALIQYFCKPCRPTRTNGQRTRNLPEHDPEKWELFKQYNAQDVVAERAIAKKLDEIEKQYAPEHALWCFDQRMNWLW